MEGVGDRNRTVDALIARYVFGEVPNPDDYGGCPTCGYDGKWSALPFYTTSLAAAWDVAERLIQQGEIDQFRLERRGSSDWLCTFMVVGPDRPLSYEAIDESPAMSICMAVLKWKHGGI
jgi:hypothetical protein